MEFLTLISLLLFPLGVFLIVGLIVSIGERFEISSRTAVAKAREFSQRKLAEAQRELAERENREAIERAEHQKKLNREAAQSAYARAYADYLPKWQAWCGWMEAYQYEMQAHDAWQKSHATAWAAYRDQATEAVEIFETFYNNVDKEARLRLELSKPEHLKSLHREAFKKAAKQRPVLGMLRLVGSEKAVDLPALSSLHGDARLRAISDLLPPTPPLSSAGREDRSAPTKPARPTPPDNLLFWQDGGEMAAPVPPDKVVWR
jgi:hypothetical protein